MSVDPIITLALRAGFALLFASALLHKVLDLERFQLTVRRYFGLSGMGDTHAAQLLAVLVLLLEAAAVLLCLAPIDGSLAAAAVVAPLLTYAGAMAVNIRQGNVLLDCGCSWGSTRQPVRYTLVVRNVLLAGIALVIALPSSTRPITVVDVMSVAAAVLIASALYAATNLLLTYSAHGAEDRT